MKILWIMLDRTRNWAEWTRRLGRTTIWMLVLSQLFCGIIWGEEPVADVTRIDALIEQLGASEFSRRESAEAELREIGLAAFERLRAASHHDDLEIRLRVRALLTRIKTQQLFADLDPVARRMLGDYATLSVSERQKRNEALLALLPQQGVDAVARIVRLEEEPALAEQVATGFLDGRMPSDPDRLRELQQILRANLADADSTPAQWLRTWILAQDAPSDALPDWERLITEVGERPDSAEREECLYVLNRCWLDALERAGRTEESAEQARRIANLIDGSDVRELHWLAWLVDHELWHAVDDFSQQFPARLEARPQLRYLIAEAELRQGRTDAAAKIAQQAFDQGTSDSRLELAIWLDDDRGMFEWAEREYRASGESLAAGDYRAVVAYYALADMLHDIEQDDRAADLIEMLSKRAEESDEIHKILEDYPRSMNESMARMHLYRALHAARQGDTPAQRQHLDEGLQYHPGEIDLLIARFRFPHPSDEFHQQTQKALAAARHRYEQEMQQQLQQISQQGLDDSTILHYSLARTLNEYAWVVSNTEGDFPQALQHSLQSNEYWPGTSAYLDTLGRCYFAVGDLENAIRYQRFALERSPHEWQIRRQFEFFESQRQKASALPESPP